jgi:hypothetical protein
MNRKSIITTIIAATTLVSLPSKGQDVFNHLGAGVSLGTDGIGVDVSTPVTNYAALRAGVSFWPKLSYTQNISINKKGSIISDNVDAEGKLNIFDIKLLADFYPSQSSSFHITAGAYFGQKQLLEVENTTMFLAPKDFGTAGIVLGEGENEYTITTDDKGIAHADLNVNSFKPYLGIGFGRAVPSKSRVSVSCDLGVQFWGTPKLGANTKDRWNMESYHKFSHNELSENDDKDLKDGLKTISKISVFPVLNIRISGRIF